MASSASTSTISAATGGADSGETLELTVKLGSVHGSGNGLRPRQLDVASSTTLRAILHTYWDFDNDQINNSRKYGGRLLKADRGWRPLSQDDLMGKLDETLSSIGICNGDRLLLVVGTSS